MAKTLQSYRSYLIRETTPRDNSTYSHWITTRDNPTEAEFEVSSIEEAKALIDGTVDAAKAEDKQKKVALAKRKAIAAIRKAERKLDKHCTAKGYCEFYPNEYLERAVIYIVGYKGAKIRINCNLSTFKIKEAEEHGHSALMQ